MKKKKMITAFTAATVAASIVAPVASANATFTDVPTTSSHYDAIQNLVERGVIKGFEDGTYRPNDTLTRGQAAKILALALNLETSKTNATFKDVSNNHQYFEYVEALAEKGIINGYEDGTFKPGEPLTRGQMAKIIVNAFGLTEATNLDLPFKDVSSQNGYKYFIQTLLNYEITEGTTDTTYSPTAAVKRGQMASFVVRAEKAIAKQDVVTGKIVNIEKDQLVLNSVKYTIPTSLQGIFNSSNLSALKDAEVSLKVEGKNIVDITSLTINAQGTKEKPVVLNGQATPVASLSPVAAESVVTFKGVLKVNSPYFQLKNIVLENEVVISKGVKQFSFDHNIKKLTVQADAEAVISGNGNIENVVIESKKAVQLNVKGTIAKLTFNSESAAIEIGPNTKVTEIVTPNNVAIEKVISNYNAVKSNIEKVNGTKVQSSSRGGGGSNSSISTSTITGKIIGTTGDTVTINDKSYTVSENLKALFANKAALKDADIRVKVKKNVITEITSLTVNAAATTLDAAGITINGNVTFNADNVKVANLKITGNVTITNKVLTSIDFSKVSIAGKVTTEASNTVARSGLVASLNNVVPVAAENPITQLKITFKDSTVAFVEIKKVGTILSAYGATEISTVALQSNGSIYADSSVVLPNLKIENGVTHVELNASIASVEIQSNNEIVIEGTGNFDKVLVKTDKPVKLETTGTIKQLGSNSTNITLGSDVKIGKTTTLTGETKRAEEVILNYDDVKDNVDVEIDDEGESPETDGLIVQVKDRFGYVTLQVPNSEGKTIKYRLLPEDDGKKLVSKGEKVPTDAKIYNGEPFIPWHVNDIEVYVVDQNDIILEAYQINAFNMGSVDLDKAEVKNNTLIYKTNYARLPYVTNFFFVINGTSNIFMPNEDEIANYNTWKLDEDGIPTLEVPLPFNYDASKSSYMTIYFDNKAITGVQDNGGLSSYFSFGNSSTEEATKLEALYYFAKATEKSYTNDEYGYEIYYITEELLGDFASYSNVSSLRLVLNEYIQHVKDSHYTSSESVKQMVLSVNEKYKVEINQYKTAKAAVDSLFAYEYYWRYPKEERLANTTTLEKIEEAWALVDSIQFEDDLVDELRSMLEDAEDYFYEYKNPKSPTQRAEEWKERHRFIFSIEPSSVNEGDLEEIENAIDDYNNLPTEVQSLLAAEKEILEKLLERLESGNPPQNDILEVSVIDKNGVQEVLLTFTEAQNNLETLYAVSATSSDTVELVADDMNLQFTFVPEENAFMYLYYVKTTDGVYEFSLEQADNEKYEVYKVSKSSDLKMLRNVLRLEILNSESYRAADTIEEKELVAKEYLETTALLPENMTYEVSIESPEEDISIIVIKLEQDGNVVEVPVIRFPD